MKTKKWSILNSTNDRCKILVKDIVVGAFAVLTNSTWTNKVIQIRSIVSKTLNPKLYQTLSKLKSDSQYECKFITKNNDHLFIELSDDITNDEFDINFNANFI